MIKSKPLETLTREKLEAALEAIGINIIKDSGPIDGDLVPEKFPQARVSPGSFTFDGYKGAFLQMTHEYELIIVTSKIDEYNESEWLGSQQDSTIESLEQLKNDIIKALYKHRQNGQNGMPNSCQIDIVSGTIYPRESGSNFAGIIMNLSFKTTAQ